MLGVEHLNVLGLDILQPIDDGALEFGQVFFNGGVGSGAHQDGQIEVK
jgi:hypothetical protein